MYGCSLVCSARPTNIFASSIFSACFLPVVHIALQYACVAFISSSSIGSFAFREENKYKISINYVRWNNGGTYVEGILEFIPKCVIRRGQVGKVETEASHSPAHLVEYNFVSLHNGVRRLVFFFFLFVSYFGLVTSARQPLVVLRMEEKMKSTTEGKN